MAQNSPVARPRQIRHRGYWRLSRSSPASRSSPLRPAVMAGDGRLRHRTDPADERGCPHVPRGYLPRGGLGDTGMPGHRRAGVAAARRGGDTRPQSRATTCGMGHALSPPAPRSGVRHRLTRVRRRRTSRAPAGGRPGPAQGQAFTQGNARRPGRVTRHRRARPRPAAIWRPDAEGYRALIPTMERPAALTGSGPACSLVWLVSRRW